MNKQILSGYPSWMNRGWREEFHEASKSYPYDQCMVMVFRFSMICGDTEKYIMGHRPDDGSRIFEPVPISAKLHPRDIERGKSFQEYLIQKTYRVNWVVGSKTIWNSGPDSIQVRAWGFSLVVCGLYACMGPI